MDVQITGDLDKIVKELFSKYQESNSEKNETDIILLGVDPVIYLEKAKSDLLKSLRAKELNEINEYLKDAMNNIERYDSNRKSVSHIVNGILNELLEQPELYPLQLDPEDGIEFLLSEEYVMPSDIIKNRWGAKWADISAKKILEKPEILKKVIDETNFIDISFYELLKGDKSIINILIAREEKNLLKKLINILHTEGEFFGDFEYASMKTDEIIQKIFEDKEFREGYLNELSNSLWKLDKRKFLLDSELYKHPDILLESGIEINSEKIINYIYEKKLIPFREIINKLYEEIKSEWEYSELIMNLFTTGMRTVIEENKEKIIFNALTDYLSNEKENTERVRKVLENINEFYETDENRKMSIREKILLSLGRFDPYREKKTYIREVLYTLDEIIECEKSKNWLDKINKQYLNIDIIMQILGQD